MIAEFWIVIAIAIGQRTVRTGHGYRQLCDGASRVAGGLRAGGLKAGDVVRVDSVGRVHIIDRRKDIINRAGENVSSVDVESAPLSAPTVADAGVLAVPDEVMGEEVGACGTAARRRST